MRIETLASGAGWRVHDVVCSSGPYDRAFEEQHPFVCIAAVMQGSFQYRTTQGAATLAPGAILLGNHGQCFECGHDHATGDRCLSFLFEPACFETILSATPHARSANFPVARLPPSMRLAPVMAAAEPARTDPATLEEIALGLAATVASLIAGENHRPVPTSRDQKRVAAALHRIEADFAEPLSLASLASEAATSRYHFLRIFHQVVGLTPHQFILCTRLHHTAVALRRSSQPILDIALQAGFADLSTFNRRFRTTMGVSPGAYRRLR